MQRELSLDKTAEGASVTPFRPTMDPLDFLENDELLRFFHCHKTEMSCMENPHTFISQLRDHNLIPEDRYQQMSRMKSKDKLKKSLYGVLDWLEIKRPKRITDFWKCVFKETIIHYYPILQLLRNRLLDGSYHDDIQLPENVEQEETGDGKRKASSEDEKEEEEKANSVRKKRKLRSRSRCDDEVGPDSSSSQMTSGQKKKNKKIHFSSPLKKGEKGEIWTWPIYKSQLPVTCGQREGILNRNRLAKGEKCIVVNQQWFTPGEFERFAGKESYKNWKLSIRCMGTSLGKLIQEGHLEAGKYKGGCKKAKKSLFPSVLALSDSDEEDKDESEESNLDSEDQVSSSSKKSSTNVTSGDEQQPEDGIDSGKMVFKVTCGAITGTLYGNRFASGRCGKSIRTETSWMTPVEFTREALGHTDASWRKVIKWEGNPISVLTAKNILRIHSLLCSCRLCRPDSEDVEYQKNDDECSICKSGEAKLVMCDSCPRSFHQRCHLPRLNDTIVEDRSPWMCTFCVFKKNEEWFYGDEMRREAAMSTEISQHMLRCQYLLLGLCIADGEQAFATDPNFYIEDYSTVINTPMWLGCVADKLQKQLYKTVGEFVSDVHLIFTNCASYNQNNAEFLTKGNTLKELFDAEFTNVFNIHQ